MTVFRGVRYAECERSAAPRPVPAWDGDLNPVLRRIRRLPGIGPALADGAERAVGTVGFYRPPAAWPPS